MAGAVGFVLVLLLLAAVMAGIVWVVVAQLASYSGEGHLFDQGGFGPDRLDVG